jgi:RNA polymerase sigma-70 factor, ECF subfamily
VDPEHVPSIDIDPRRESVYQELRRLAEVYLSRQPVGHTLQPTALVHEAYLRLLRRKDFAGLDVAGFFALAATAMRSALVDHARRRGRIKRGGGAARLPLDEVVDMYEEKAVDLIALDEALNKLAGVEPDQVRVIELRFFGGLSAEETASMLGVSPRTVGRIWNRARAWLKREMSGGWPHDDQ